MLKKLLIFVIILTACKSNPVESQTKNFFSTGILSVELNETITVARIEGTYLRIKYLGYSGKYATIIYTGLDKETLDNSAGFIYDSVKYPLQLDLLINKHTVNIEVLLITPVRFYFKVIKYTIR